MALRRGVDDDVAILDQLHAQIIVADIADDELNPPGRDQVRDVGDIAGIGHLVEHDDAMFRKGRGHRLDEVRSDEAGAARNHDFSHFNLQPSPTQ